jgi:hypothetical protein
MMEILLVVQEGRGVVVEEAGLAEVLLAHLVQMV